jgi:hypothetical protein
VTAAARAVAPPRRQRRARQLRLLDRFHRQARRDLRELGADATAMQALDELVERQRLVLWRGGR